MKKLLIIPDKDNLTASLSIAKEYNLGFEYNDFFDSDILDDERTLSEIIKEYRSYSLPEYTTVHGAFIDIAPFSSDKRIKEISLLRINQSVEAARKIGAKAVVFHLNYNPFLNSPAYVECFTEQNIEIWRNILKSNSDVNIYLENMFEKGPDILKQISQHLSEFENFGVCLDWAHASLSDVEPQKWAETLARYIKHIHINDNDLISDLHLSLGDGKIDRFAFYECYKKYMNNATVLIETNSIENQKKSLEQLKSDGVLC